MASADGVGDGVGTSLARPSGFFRGAPGYVTVTTRPVGALNDALDIPGSAAGTERLLDWLNQNTATDIESVIQTQIANLEENPLGPAPTKLDGTNEVETFGIFAHHCRSFAFKCVTIYNPNTDPYPSAINAEEWHDLHTGGCP